MSIPTESSDQNASSGATPKPKSTPYEIRVNGRLSEQSAIWFDGMDLTVDEKIQPPQTIIYGDVLDQAALYGLISRIRDLGLTLISVRCIDGEEEIE